MRNAAKNFMPTADISMTAKDTIRAGLMKARAYLEEGQYSEAYKACDELSANYPQSWQPDVVKTRTAFLQNDLSKAEAAIAQLELKNAPELVIHKLRCTLVRHKHDVHGQIISLQNILAHEPDVENWHRQLIDVLSSTQNTMLFFKALKAYLDLNPKAEISYATFLKVMRNMKLGAFIDCISDLTREFSENRSLRLSRAAALAKADRLSEGWNDIIMACQNNENIVFPASLLRKIRDALAEDPSYPPKVEALYKSNPKSSTIFWLYSNMLDSFGKVDAYQTLIKDNWDWVSKKNPTVKATLCMLAETGEVAPDKHMTGQKLFHSYLLADEIEKAIDVAPTQDEAAVLKQIMDARRERKQDIDYRSHFDNVTISGPDRPNGTVLVFGGFDDKYWLPANTLDHIFAEVGLTAIYLKDFTRLIYLDGIKTLGSSYDETISELSRRINHINPGKPIYTFGQSAGSLAAMIYGEALNAEASLVFSPNATIDLDDQPLLGEERHKLIWRRLFKNLDPTKFDLEKILERSSISYRVTAYVGADHELDVNHAKMIEKMPRTKVHYLEGLDSHNAFMPAASRLGLVNIVKLAYLI